MQPQIGTNTDGSKVFVTWAESSSNDIKFKRSIDSGETFTAVVNIDTAGTDNSPKLDSLGENVYIAWQDAGAGGGDIFFRSSDDGGATFDNKQNLSNDGTLSASQQLDSMLIIYNSEGVSTNLDNALVIKRNRIMTDRMIELIEKKSTFIAIGVLHLPGEIGVIELLRKRGYTVKPVYSYYSK